MLCPHLVKLPQAAPAPSRVREVRRPSAILPLWICSTYVTSAFGRLCAKDVVTERRIKSNASSTSGRTTPCDNVLC